MAAVTLLSGRGLNRQFGGLQAVRNVDFDLAKGEIRALIGPNGAGKTTLVSMLCGRIPVSSGTIAFNGQDITALPAHRRIQEGMAYTFQITSIFGNLSVSENVALAVQRRLKPNSPIAPEVTAALDRVGLSDRAEQIAGDLAYGHQRLLEIAMGLAQQPQLLILDEPTQGLSDGEVQEFIALIKDVAASTTILLIEHNIDVVMALAEKITVMNFGEIIAEGTPEAIHANEAVQAAYLGGLMLEVRNISAGYGKVEVLRDFSLSAQAGEILCLLGRNGAGKTTLMKSIMGLIRPGSGSVHLGGEEISSLPAFEVPRHGIGYIPQGRRLFTELTVEENLQIGLMARRSDPKVREHVLDMFPRLRERLDQRAETLSGGEQQMLATARALCLEPRVLLLDEPTEGLQPSMIALIRKAVVELKEQGVAVVLVEQRVDAVLEIADRVVFVENGRNVLEATPEKLRTDESLIHRYVGV